MLGILPFKDPLECIETDIRLARILNSVCRISTRLAYKTNRLTRLTLIL